MSIEWMNQYNTIKRTIVLKRQEGKNVSQNDIKQLSSSINGLEKDLKTMTAAAMEYELSASEIARRQIILENLRKLMAQFTVAGAPLGATIGGGTPAPMQFNSNFSTQPAANEAAVAMNPLNTSDRGLVQRQKDIIKLQDDMMLDISKGVDRLHDQAVTIGEEAKVHMQILDKLDTQVDLATEGLREEAKHAEEINNKTRVCSLYLCIALEVVAIIVLLIFALGAVKS